MNHQFFQVTEESRNIIKHYYYDSMFSQASLSQNSYSFMWERLLFIQLWQSFSSITQWKFCSRSSAQCFLLCCQISSVDICPSGLTQWPLPQPCAQYRTSQQKRRLYPAPPWLLKSTSTRHSIQMLHHLGHDPTTSPEDTPWSWSPGACPLGLKVQSHKTLFFKSSLSFTAKLRGRNRDFPYTSSLPLHMPNLLHYQNPPPKCYIWCNW